MKFFITASLLLSTLSAFPQKAITNEVSGELRLGLGVTSSKLFNWTADLDPISAPAISLYYTPQIAKRLELQTGISADARGGKLSSPFVKYRSYNANALIGVRYRLNDLRIGGGIDPVYFIDTRKSVLEGSLSGGVLNVPVRNFIRYDIPVYVDAEIKLHEKLNLELRSSVSFQEPTFLTFTTSLNYCIAQRYKREKIKTN
jgi:hypothetical protein